MSGKRHKKGLWLDPRAKLFLILMCVLSSMFAPSLAYQFVLVMLIAVLGAFFGKWKYVIKAVCFYAVICVLTVWIMAEMTGTLRTMFIAFLGLFHKVYAEKVNGVWEQRLRIHYNCVGTIEIPSSLPLPTPDVSVNTRKGVVVNYAPCDVAI